MAAISHATLTPSRVVAGDSVEFVVHVDIGTDYAPGPSRLVFDLPGTLGMSRPTRMHQESHGFVTVRVSNPEVTYREYVWDMEIADFVSKTKQSWRGMAARMAVVDLGSGLRRGDSIELRWGASTRGYGPGTTVTSVVPRPNYTATIHVRYFVDPDGGLPDYGRSFEGYDRPVPDQEVPLGFEVLPREPNHLRLVRKVERALLIPHDRYWNVAQGLEVADLVESSQPSRSMDSGVFEYPDARVRIRSLRLPITKTPTFDSVFNGHNIYWGDIHTHSAYSIDCVEREKLDMTPGDLMASARDRAGLDFYATTDHHQPWDIPRHRLGREAWEATLADVDAHHRPGEFCVFPGIEFRCPRGDTVIVFNEMPPYDLIDQQTYADVRAMWTALAGHDALTIPHFHNPGRLADGEWWFAPPSSGERGDRAIEPVLEIFSCHGSYEREDALERHIPLIKASRPDRYGVHFLRRGHHYGFVANSDGHKGHVGTNGLTAVYARELTREAILDAYRRRHVYGTTNARIRLLFTGNGHLMGDVVANTPNKTLAIAVVGETELKKVELFRNGDLHRRFAPRGRSCSETVEIEDANPSFWYVRATQLDNHIAYSSPIWFE